MPPPTPPSSNFTVPAMTNGTALTNGTAAGTDDTGKDDTSTSAEDTMQNDSSSILSTSAILFITVPLVALAAAFATRCSSKKKNTESTEFSSTDDLIEDTESPLADSEENGNDLNLNQEPFHKIGRRDQSDLMIIKKGISKALNGTSGYSPTNDSEKNSPFEHPSISI